MFDPPWGEGLEKRRELYGGVWVDMYSRALDGIAAVTRPGGRVIIFGYNSSGLGESRGFTLTELCHIHFTGNHYDVTVTVERLDGDGQGEGGQL